MTALALRLNAVADHLGCPETWGRLLARAATMAGAIGLAGALLAVLLAPAATVAKAAVDGAQRRLTALAPLPRHLGEPRQRSVVLARDGSVLAVLHDEQNRKLVSLERIPDRVVNAVVATEDAGFFAHHGVDWQAIVRAAAGNLRAGEVTSGASTITQQLVKQLVLKDSAQTFDRKAREAVYALQLEQRLSKRQILDEYLNLAYFGNGVYGIGTAAEYYFDTDVSDLGVAQAALLAGIIHAPLANDPLDHPEAARRRRDIVLAQMAASGFLTASEAERLQRAGLGLRPSTAPPRGDSLFVTYVRELLKGEPALGEDVAARENALLRGGLTIRTTLDPRLQRLAGSAIAEVLRNRAGPQAALTVVDPRSGEILAVGAGPRPYGRGKGRTSVTPAVRGLGSPSGRQAGSAFKPFQLVAALESGISPNLVFQAGSHYRFTREECPRGYRPGNYADASQGRLDMAAATALSSNTYFAHLADLTGVSKLTDVAGRMGIRGGLRGLCSTVLGSEEVFGLDMAAAYGTLANDGVYCRPYAISEVVDRRGRTILRPGAACTRAVDAAVARRTTALLRGPMTHGTAARHGRIGRPAAGKTGTTDDYGNAWFVGYVPQLSASVWVGHPGRVRTMHDARCSGGQVTGGCLPTMIWAQFMGRAVEGMASKRFRNPPPLPRGRVPDLLGTWRADAVKRLHGYGFDAEIATTSDYHPEGTVLGQSPAAGERLELGKPVTVAVSDGQGLPPQVPDVVGLHEAEAVASLASAGFPADVVPVTVGQRLRDGRVVMQTPAGGSRGLPTTPVTISVGSYQAPPDPQARPQPPPAAAEPGQ